MTAPRNSHRIIWLAICHDCQPILAVPFDTENKCHTWAGRHRKIGHNVHCTFEVRHE